MGLVARGRVGGTLHIDGRDRVKGRGSGGVDLNWSGVDSRLSWDIDPISYIRVSFNQSGS